MSEEPTSAGHFVRPFIMTKGRTHAEHPDIHFESLVQGVGLATRVSLPSEQAALLRAAEEPISVAELAAELDLVIGVVAVAVGDLVDAGYLEVFASGVEHIELEMLNRISEKIRSL